MVRIIPLLRYPLYLLHLRQREFSLACMIFLDSHCIGLSRNIIFRFEETLIGFNCTFCQIYAVCLFLKSGTWFVESDMSVVSKTEKLEVYTALFADDLHCNRCRLCRNLLPVRPERKYGFCRCLHDRKRLVFMKYL